MPGLPVAVFDLFASVAALWWMLKPRILGREGVGLSIEPPEG